MKGYRADDVWFDDIPGVPNDGPYVPSPALTRFVDAAVMAGVISYATWLTVEPEPLGARWLS